jgi:glycopeptide antibiotics resistance protein
MQSSETAAVAAPSTGAGRRHHRWIAPLLFCYAVALSLVAFWPVPVDRGFDGLLYEISVAVPWLTYDVIEFTANVLLFVPLGALLALLIHRHRWIVVLISLAVTVAIEWAQAEFLDERTSSVRDVVANLLGAVIGLAIVVIVERAARRWRRP